MVVIGYSIQHGRSYFSNIKHFHGFLLFLFIYSNYGRHFISLKQKKTLRKTRGIYLGEMIYIFLILNTFGKNLNEILPM